MLFLFFYTTTSTIRQLFGDTVNTAARMETTGMIGRIHLSAETATLLTDQHDMGHLITKRADVVKAKGKGELQTYWLASKTTSAKSRRVARSIKSATTYTSGSGDSSGEQQEHSRRSGLGDGTERRHRHHHHHEEQDEATQRNMYADVTDRS